MGYWWLRIDPRKQGIHRALARLPVILMQRPRLSSGRVNPGSFRCLYQRSLVQSFMNGVSHRHCSTFHQTIGGRLDHSLGAAFT